MEAREVLCDPLSLEHLRRVILTKRITEWQREKHTKKILFSQISDKTVLNYQEQVCKLRETTN